MSFLLQRSIQIPSKPWPRRKLPCLPSSCPRDCLKADQVQGSSSTTSEHGQGVAEIHSQPLGRHGTKGTSEAMGKPHDLKSIYDFPMPATEAQNRWAYFNFKELIVLGQNELG